MVSLAEDFVCGETERNHASAENTGDSKSGRAGLKGTEMKLDCNPRKGALRIAYVVKRVLKTEGDLLVEFAMMLPVLIMIVTGVGSFSMAFLSLQELSNATTSAVQYVAADQGMSGDPCATAAAQMTAALPSWTAGNFSYRLAITNSSGTTYYPSQTGWTSGTFSCASGATQEINASVVLTVKYSYTWLPILLFNPTTPLTATQSAVTD
jgi:Flp pilus assembly protein TadG